MEPRQTEEFTSASLPHSPGGPTQRQKHPGNEAVAEPLTRPPTPRPRSCTARCRELGSSGESSGSRERSGKREASRTSTQVLTAQLTRRRGFPRRRPPRPSQNPGCRFRAGGVHTAPKRGPYLLSGQTLCSASDHLGCRCSALE